MEIIQSIINIFVYKLLILIFIFPIKASLPMLSKIHLFLTSSFISISLRKVNFVMISLELKLLIDIPNVLNLILLIVICFILSKSILIFPRFCNGINVDTQLSCSLIGICIELDSSNEYSC